MPNPYVNKVVTSSGTTLIDISESNIAADDVLYGKRFYDASGAPRMGSVLLGTEYITPSDEKQIFIPPIDSVELIDEIQGSNVALESSQKNYLPFDTGAINNNIPCLLAGTIDVHWSYTEQLGDSYSGTWTFTPSGVPLELYDESLDDYVENDYLYISRYDYDRGLHGCVGTFSATYSGDTTWKCNQPVVTIQGDTITITPIPSTSAGSYSFSCDYHLYLYKPVFAGYKFYSAIEVEAASGGAPSQTQRTIYFEFEDNTNMTITAYWDGTFISDAIRATTPRTYNNKTVTLAQLDGVTWYSYDPNAIPLNTQLIDYSACVANTTIGYGGDAEELEWYYATDYTMVHSDMTFSYIAGTWTYIAFYDSSKAFLSVITVHEDGTVDPDDGNLATGTLTPSKIPSNAKYVRMSSVWYDDENLSLIRTA